MLTGDSLFPRMTVVGLAGAALLASYNVWDLVWAADAPWQQRQSLTADLGSVQARNEGALARIRRLEGQLQALVKRPEVQARVVRQELGYVADNEVILRWLPAP